MVSPARWVHAGGGHAHDCVRKGYPKNMTGQETVSITPDLMLRAYRAGLFPMAPDARSDDLEWFYPEMRGILPLDDGFHASRRLMRTVLSARFAVVTDQDFPAVMAAESLAPSPTESVGCEPHGDHCLFSLLTSLLAA